MTATADATLEVVNPATGDSIASIPNMSADEVDAAVERARTIESVECGEVLELTRTHAAADLLHAG